MPKIKLLVLPPRLQDYQNFFCSTKTTIHWPQYIKKNRKSIGSKKFFCFAINWLKNTVFYTKMDQKIPRSEFLKFWSKELLKPFNVWNFQLNQSKNGFSRAIFLFCPILAPKIGFLPISPFWVDRFQKFLGSETSMVGPTFGLNLGKKLKIRGEHFAPLSQSHCVKSCYYL